MNKRIKRKICNIISKNGEQTILKRKKENQELDMRGEPPNGIWVMDEFPITIAINSDKREVENTPVGGMVDDRKEILYFIVESTVDIRTGDKLVYPPETPNEWLIYFVEPSVVLGSVIAIEAKAHRDNRY